MGRIFVEQDGKVFEKMEREFAARGYILDIHNGELVVQWFESNPAIAVTPASVTQAIESMRDRLHWKSQNQMEFEATVKSSGLSQQHLDVLEQWLHSRKLIDVGDEGYSNRVQFINYMRGRDWTFENLDRGITYLQGNSRTALHWQILPSQNQPSRGHNANRPPTPNDMVWISKDEANSPYLGRPNHARNSKFNGELERQQKREAERRVGVADSTTESARAVEFYWQGEINKLIATGVTHSERNRIAQVAQQTPGSARQRHSAVKAEADAIRRSRELSR
jgi:hypothetical protein